MIHPVSYISETIQWIDLAENLPTNISEQVYISKVKEVYWSSNTANYICQVL